MSYTFDWRKAFGEAEEENRKLLDEHIGKVYTDKLFPIIRAKAASDDETHMICTLAIKKFWERFFINKEKLPDNVNGYLFRMANNAFLDHRKLKSREKIKTSSVDLEKVNQLLSPHFVDDSTTFGQVDPFEEKEQIYVALEQAFIKLDTKCKDLLKLNFFEKKRIKDIYQQLNIPTANAATKKKDSCLKKLEKFMYKEMYKLKNT